MSMILQVGSLVHNQHWDFFKRDVVNRTGQRRVQICARADEHHGGHRGVVQRASFLPERAFDVAAQQGRQVRVVEQS
jgi:hypothetical protein